MKEELKKYKYVKKSNFELETERIIDGVSNRLWIDSDYLKIYYIGILNQLHAMAEGLGSHYTINQDDILMLVSTYKTNKNAPDEIKNLANMILEEFDYKEAN